MGGLIGGAGWKVFFSTIAGFYGDGDGSLVCSVRVSLGFLWELLSLMVWYSILVGRSDSVGGGRVLVYATRGLYHSIPFLDGTSSTPESRFGMASLVIYTPSVSKFPTARTK